jgi:hypothetical protein
VRPLFKKNYKKERRRERAREGGDRPRELAAQVGEVQRILAQRPHLHIDEIGIANAIGAFPAIDPVRAARYAVALAAGNEHWTSGARALRAGLPSARQFGR